VNRGETKARLTSPGDWGEIASAEMTRYSTPKPDRRRGPRICPWACSNKATHYGMANGMALTAGCEFHIAGWVRDGNWP
jgi:hypothetical protein